MKKLLLILAVVLVSCSAEDTTQTEQQDCYRILARGEDSRGDYIIINYQDFIQRRYKVDNYLDYLNKTEICEPINLTEQQL